MKLLFTATAYPPSIGGAQLHTHALVRELSKRNETQVATIWDANRTDWLLGTTLRTRSEPHDYDIDGVRVRALGFSRRERLHALSAVARYYLTMPSAVVYLATQLLPKLRELLPSAAIVHNSRIGREPLTWASWLLAKERGVPFVLTPFHHPRWTGWRYRVYHELYRRADRILALTNAEKGALIRLGVAEDRITVTGGGPTLAPSSDPEGFRRKYGITGPMVLFLGQCFRYKGWRDLLAAAPLVWSALPETRFVFVGPSVGDSERVFNRLREQRIVRLGAVSLQEKTDAIAACDAVCLPSTQESFGMVFVEAWSLGKPVIGCPIPAVAELVHQGIDGLLVEQEPAAVAAAVSTLLADPARARQMGEAGRREVQQRYSWPLLANMTEAAFESALQRRTES